MTEIRPEAVALSLERRARDGTLHTEPEVAAATIRRLIAERDAATAAIAEIVAERDVLKARVRDGWSVESAMLYDEEGVDGWRWSGPNGEELYQVAWDDDLPSLPDEWNQP